MPYEGEFAQYKPLKRLAESERVKELLRRSKSRVLSSQKTENLPVVNSTSTQPNLWSPDWVLAIDGSHLEESVKNGFPGAEISYVTVASVMLDMAKIRSLDNQRPVNPVEYRKTEESESIDSAFPGCNVVLDNDTSAKSSLRKAIFEVFSNTRVFPECESLLDTYEVLFDLKPPSKEQKCPYDEDCGYTDGEYQRKKGCYTCSCQYKRPFYSTDGLRIHEGMAPAGKNGAMFAEIMGVLERLWLIHILRSLEQKDWLSVISRLAIMIDGPLAVFGHPAWLSYAIRKELFRLNKKIKLWTGGDILLLGIEKSGVFVNHLTDLDTNENGVAGKLRSGQALLLTDRYIKQNIIFSDSSKPYGQDTYFGRKFFYKTASSSLIVATIPYLDESHANTTIARADQFPRLIDALSVLDQLSSSRYPNSLTPIISAHAEAAIPLNIGKRVLAEIAKKLMRG